MLQLTVYNYNGGSCYGCLFPTPPPRTTCQSCVKGGVLGVGNFYCFCELHQCYYSMLVSVTFTWTMPTIRLNSFDILCFSKFSHGLVVIYTILLATTKNESDFLIPFAQVVSINMEVSLYLSHIFSWKGGFCRFTGSQLGLKVCLISWMLLCYYTIVRRKFKMGNQRVKRLNKNDT